MPAKRRASGQGQQRSGEDENVMYAHVSLPPLSLVRLW